MRESAVGNVLSPTVDSRVGGTISADVYDDLSCFELMSATRRRSSEIFRRQCRSRRSGVTLSNLRFEKIRRASSFKTDCSLLNM